MYSIVKYINDHITEKLTLEKEEVEKLVIQLNQFIGDDGFVYCNF